MEIKKLADIVEWADGRIRDGGYYEEKYNNDASTAYCNVKAHELWRIRDVALESIDRHAVYTNSLNKDIADKAAKIEKLEKEIEGRKAGYYNLKDRLDTAREIEDHWKREYETLTTNFSAKSVELNEANNKINDLKEEIKKLNKCIMNKNESINTGNEAIINLRKEIGAHEEENKRLSDKIIELKKERDKHMARVNDLRIELDCVKASKEKHEEAARDKVVEDLRETISYWRNKYVAAQEEIEKLDGTIEEWKNQERIRTDQLRATERKVEELWKEIEKFTKGEDDDYGKSGFKRYVEHLIEEEERAVPERFKARLNEEITAIFTKEEETEVKGNGRTSSGRYPWGAKVNDIPCGEDAIE